MSRVRHFIHREHSPSDPAFLHDEREFLDHERDALHVMERHRDQLERTSRTARRGATALGISLEHAPESGYRAWLR